MFMHRPHDGERPHLPRSAPEVLVHEAGRRTGEPALSDRFSQHRLGDVLQLDEDRCVAVKVRNREESPWLRGEHGLLLAKIRHANRENRSLRRDGLAEPLDVCLAERPFPREALPGDKLGARAVTLTLSDLRQSQSHPSRIIDGHHFGTVPALF
jgi:hypothetical protein